MDETTRDYVKRISRTDIQAPTDCIPQMLALIALELEELNANICVLTEYLPTAPHSR